MSDDSFVQTFIDSYAAGQQARTHKRLEQNAEEDRDIEKQLLQHRLRELKISEKIRAREAAKNNYDMQQGTPEADLPRKASSSPGMEIPGGISIPPISVPNAGAHERMAPVNVPGIEEWGIPGVSRRPQSMEEVLQELLTQKRGEARSRGYELGEGESVAVPGQKAEDPYEVIKGQPKTFAPRAPRPLLRDVERGPDEVETTVYRNPDDPTQIVARGSSRNRLKNRGGSGGGGGLRMTEDDVAVSVEAAKQGNYDFTNMPQSELGEVIKSRMLKAGIDVRQGRTDAIAFNKYLGGLNAGDQLKVIQASDIARQAMADLEKAVTANDPQAGEIAAATLRTQIPIINANGSAATTKALDDAMKTFKPGWSVLGMGSGMGKMKPEIDKLKAHLGYRNSAIKSSFTSSAEAGGIPNQPAPIAPTQAVPGVNGVPGTGGAGVIPGTGTGMVPPPPPVKPPVGVVKGNTSPQANSLNKSPTQILAELRKQGRLPPDPTAAQAMVARIMADPAALSFLFTGK